MAVDDLVGRALLIMYVPEVHREEKLVRCYHHLLKARLFSDSAVFHPNRATTHGAFVDNYAT